MNLSLQLHTTAKQYPEKIAYVFLDEEVTYADLDTSITLFANGLKRLGVQKGDHIALLLGNSPHFIIGLYGALRVGATVIPINPTYTKGEITYVLQNSDAKVAITLDLLVPLLEEMKAEISALEHLVVCESSLQKEHNFLSSNDIHSFSSIVQHQDVTYKFPTLDEDDTALILYTSGTTGKPKGAMLTQKNVYQNAKDVADYLSINGEDRVVAALPMFHVFCLTVALNAPLMNGGTVLVMPKFSPTIFFQLAEEKRATIFAGVPTMYNFLLQSNKGAQEKVKTLRLCISGGASMPVALLKEFEKQFGVVVAEGYGLSEASPVTCFNPIDKERKPGSIGTSIMNVENKVVDEIGREVPVGEVGELIVKGANVMKGYYKLPEDTAHALRDGWLYTGDLARMDPEGYFYIVDRKKDMIIVGGYNVYPREVEEVLYSHPNVVEVAVLGVPDPVFGEQIKCYVVVKDAAVSEQDLLDYCQLHLAKYKIPSSITFLDELPKNATGKILRKALRKELLGK
ncbi:fatty acid--CoA ligase family protein [Priestia flexa]|uniref:Long-chain fatty acid--CoA ligase n=1 Tax=Priestia veravalensis TaxID=1414648 RepID=A0A0V8JPM0_9BACI|nr:MULTISPECIES: fatty acid--CoA ligase family protein [Bacillaceae]KSU88876.1 long-chain fatty acid--CoA ligase [Priestia veravalensis]KZB90627.1 long-chain fatty acid--CoA ligase [Bacillus sp. VT 712]MCG7315602.1 fatty acid--CoA ligase family protein [Priestia flexa]SCC01916.1 long-chain acyl-CoA synthetase [Priestia flexa]SIR05288.1 long-chain acyl-CoA synthetase [Priestia flexa]